MFHATPSQGLDCRILVAVNHLTYLVSLQPANAAPRTLDLGPTPLLRSGGYRWRPVQIC